MFYRGCCLALVDCGGGRGWAADVLAVRRWWMERRQLVLVCRLVQKVAVCQTVGSSSQTEGFRRSFKVLICCTGFSPVAEATDGGLKGFICVKVNVIGLEGPACWSSMTMKEVGCPLDCCCCPLLATWFC